MKLSWGFIFSEEEQGRILKMQVDERSIEILLENIYQRKLQYLAAVGDTPGGITLPIRVYEMLRGYLRDPRQYSRIITDPSAKTIFGMVMIPNCSIFTAFIPKEQNIRQLWVNMERENLKKGENGRYTGV